MTKLERLIYLGFPKRAGHTWTEVNGVKSNPDAILIVANERHKKDIDLPKEQMVSLSELEMLEGKAVPIVVDHFALRFLVQDCINYYRDEIVKLEKRIDKAQMILKTS